ncbi:MAG: hemerythrin family protein [Magnetococcales bacterium]|nr:hemerythrin family protein [Magnetococcales bacterium]
MQQFPYESSAQFRERLHNQLPDVGVTDFNKDHQQFLDHLIKFHELVEKDSKKIPLAKDWKLIEETVNFLNRYAKNHFDAEEKLMVKYSFVKLDSHAQEHRECIVRIDDLKNNLIIKKEILYIVDLKFYMLEWLFHHIKNVDMEYKPFFKERLSAKKFRSK